MKSTVASLLSCAASTFVLGACGGSVQLEAGQAYCMSAAEEAGMVRCDDFNNLLLATADGKLQNFLAYGEVGFVDYATLKGSRLTSVDEGFPTAKLKRVGDDFKFSGGEYDSDFSVWLVRAETGAGRRFVELGKDWAAFDPSAPPPSDQPAYVDVPLCFEEQNYRDGQRRYYQHGCDSYAVIFTSVGEIISLDVDTAGSGDGVEWEHNGKWSTENGVGRPDQYADFEWSLTVDGSPKSERKREKKNYQLGSGQAFDRSVRETELAYPLYTGPSRDTWIEAYQAQIYPELRKRKLILKHFPELER